jgi:murein DD-endopeptidase MepM/ murein hydrolase activator NlpD
LFKLLLPLLLAAAPALARELDENDHALNPTGGPVRVEGMDKWGGGEYLARRNDPDYRGLSVHRALDFVGKPGQDVIAPISGVLRRTGQGINTGADIEGRIRGSRYKVKLMHFAVTVRDGLVTQGQVIGRLKDIGRTYPGMKSHVHMETHEWNGVSGFRAKDPSIVIRSPDDTAQRPK